jgi:hypothetical protein
VQSVQRLATGWTTEGSEFEYRYGQEFSLLHVVQTSSGVHPACRGQENVDLYIHSPIRPHGAVLN